MKRDVKIGLLSGLSFAGLAYIPVRFMGFNSSSFIVISYLYVIMGLYMAFKLERNGFRGLMDRFIGNLVLVSEGEELLLRKLATGERYKVKGEVEKLQ